MVSRRVLVGRGWGGRSRAVACSLALSVLLPFVAVAAGDLRSWVLWGLPFVIVTSLATVTYLARFDAGVAPTWLTLTPPLYLFATELTDCDPTSEFVSASCLPPPPVTVRLGAAVGTALALALVGYRLRDPAGRVTDRVRDRLPTG